VNRILLAAVAVASIVFVDGCPRRTLQTGACASDLDCPENTACNAARGVCACIDDAACNPDEFCNVQGACQPLLQCVDNDDCRGEGDTTNICDVGTGGCVALSPTLQCLLDSHCPFGAYCDSGLCRDGCRDDADCALGAPCIAGSCNTAPGACSAERHCRYGESCNVSTSRCVAHRLEDVLCTACESLICLSDADCPDGVRCDIDPLGLTVGTCAVCGNDPAISCLIDSSVPQVPCTNDNTCTPLGGSCQRPQCLQNSDCESGTCQGGSPGGFFTPPTLGRCSTGFCRAEFCGTDTCNDNSDPCPRGYECNEIRTVSKACTRGGGECDGTEFCSADAGGENNNAGFCSCDADSDCGDGSACVDPGPRGRCVIGTSCGPTDGLLCRNLLQ
jgi:hypothetical protein